MSDNATIVQNAVEAFNKGNADALGGLFSRELQKGATSSIKSVRADAADLHYKIQHIKAEGDNVAFSYVVTGTFKGKAASWSGSGMATVVNGKITALQNTEDVISKSIQLGGKLGGILLQPSLTGKWSGSAQGITVTLTLVQSGSTVSGTAVAFGATFPVAGTVNFPNVSLHGSMNGVAVNFSGAYNPQPNTIPGTLTAMGSSMAVTLNRQ